MFLDERLFELAKNGFQTEEEAVRVVKAMLNECNTYVLEHISKKDTEAEIRRKFNRVDLIWKKVVGDLKKQGVDGLREDGWRNYILMNDKLKWIYS